MAFIKKTFEDGQTFGPDDANNIQEQYDDAVQTMNDIQADFALSLNNETFEGNGSQTTFNLSSNLISQPVIVVKRIADSNYKAETVSLNSSSDVTQWKYDLDSNIIVQNSGSVLSAGEFVRVGYILKMLPHASTHSIGGSDEININDIDGLTADEINDLISSSGGVTEGTATTIAENIKKDSNIAAVCRTITDLGQILNGEIAVTQ